MSNLDADTMHGRSMLHRRASRKLSPRSCHARIASSIPSSNATVSEKSNHDPKKHKSGKGKKSHSCFPYGASFHGKSKKPSGKRSSWWCNDNKAVGFLGFSLPLEAYDASDPSYSVDRLTQQFTEMKKSYGARFVRIYAPQANDPSIWANLIDAAVATDMAVLPMVWWGFGSDPNGNAKACQAALLSEIKSNPLAPYVFHSVAFGSEPIGDGVDGGIQQFTSDFIAFKAELKAYGIPAAISEDWYRYGTLLDNNGDLTADGQTLMDAQDLVHAHVMPYYSSDDSQFPSPTGASAWPYVQDRVETFYPKISGGKKVMVTEMQWASFMGAHGRDVGSEGVSLGDEQAFWDNNGAKDHCSSWKDSNTGYFFHVWSDNSGEDQFGLLDTSDKPKFPWRAAC